MNMLNNNDAIWDPWEPFELTLYWLEVKFLILISGFLLVKNDTDHKWKILRKRKWYNIN